VSVFVLSILTVSRILLEVTLKIGGYAQDLVEYVQSYALNFLKTSLASSKIKAQRPNISWRSRAFERDSTFLKRVYLWMLVISCRFLLFDIRLGMQ
jgi:hypothetical protein